MFVYTFITFFRSSQISRTLSLSVFDTGCFLVLRVTLPFPPLPPLAAPPPLVFGFRLPSPFPYNAYGHVLYVVFVINLNASGYSKFQNQFVHFIFLNWQWQCFSLVLKRSSITLNITETKKATIFQKLFLKWSTTTKQVRNRSCKNIPVGAPLIFFNNVKNSCVLRGLLVYWMVIYNKYIFLHHTSVFITTAMRFVFQKWVFLYLNIWIASTCRHVVVVVVVLYRLHDEYCVLGKII